MSISIVINTETPEDAREHMLALLGLTQKGTPWGEQTVPLRGVESVQNDAGHRDTFVVPEGHAAVRGVDGRATGATRERGQPAPGKARRTKAEIEEDAAADRADARNEQLANEDIAREAAAEAAETAAISTGDERVGPEDDAETIEQDEADEAAETAAAVEERPADKKLTHDDVRHALGAYVKLYGIAAAQADGPKVIALVCGEGKVKVSDVPDDQAMLAKVVAGVDEMTAKNPFKRDKVA